MIWADFFSSFSLFFFNVFVLFINVCKIVIDAVVCAQLISTWIEIRICQMMHSFCIYFVLYVLFMRMKITTSLRKITASNDKRKKWVFIMITCLIIWMFVQILIEMINEMFDKMTDEMIDKIFNEMTDWMLYKMLNKMNNIIINWMLSEMSVAILSLILI